MVVYQCVVPFSLLRCCIIWVSIDMSGQIITVVVGVCASTAVTSTP